MTNPGRHSASVDRPRSRADLHALGVTDSVLLREHTRLMRGQWLHGSVTPTAQHLLRAALQRGPDDAFLTHDTAAAWHDGIVPASGVVHLGTLSGKRMRATGLMLHRYADEPEVVTFRGLPVTSKAQTCLDLAPLLGLVDLIVLGDSFSLGHPETVEELRRLAASGHGRGVVNARRAAALVRDGAESAQETRTRLLMVLAGLPEPVLQHPMLNEQRREIHRLDMAHVDAKVAIEYDGDGHLDRLQREKDVVRRALFEAQDWRFIEVVSADVYKRPAAFLERASTTMRARGVEVPRRLDPQWLLHFGM